MKTLTEPFASAAIRKRTSEMRMSKRASAGWRESALKSQFLFLRSSYRYNLIGSSSLEVGRNHGCLLLHILGGVVDERCCARLRRTARELVCDGEPPWEKL